jgi:hypothetical protein
MLLVYFVSLRFYSFPPFAPIDRASKLALRTYLLVRLVQFSGRVFADLEYHARAQPSLSFVHPNANIIGLIYAQAQIFYFMPYYHSGIIHIIIL